MEISKPEKFDISNIFVRANRSPLYTKIMGMDAATAIVVEGVERETLSGAMTYAKKQNPEKGFKSQKMGVMKFRVIRIS